MDTRDQLVQQALQVSVRPKGDTQREDEVGRSDSRCKDKKI